MGMDPNLDPSMDRSLQQEEEDQYDDEGIEVAVDDEQDDPDPGVNHAVTNLACCNIVWQDEGCTSVLMIHTAVNGSLAWLFLWPDTSLSTGWCLHGDSMRVVH